MIAPSENRVFLAFVGDKIHVFMARAPDESSFTQFLALSIEHHDLLPRLNLWHIENFARTFALVIGAFWNLRARATGTSAKPGLA